MSEIIKELNRKAPAAERRRHPRHPIAEEVIYAWDGGEERGRLLDIGLGGLRLLTRGPLPLLQHLRVFIGRASETCLEGIIVWSSRIESQHSVAVRFDNLTSSHRDAIRKLIPEP